ncbi:MAG TPA: DUF4160 domain-containing protein, partial [Anaerolineae bacterium]
SDCGEPRHIHADRDRLSAKFWLDPLVTLSENHGYNRSELRGLERILIENLELMRNEWDSFCNG